MRSCEANGTWSGNVTTCKSKKTQHLTRLQSSITTSSRGARGVMGRWKAKERVFPSSPFPSTPAPVARVTRRRLGMSHTLHILCYESNSCFTLSTDNGSALSPIHLLMHYFTLMIRRRVDLFVKAFEQKQQFLIYLLYFSIVSEYSKRSDEPSHKFAFQPISSWPR